MATQLGWIHSDAVSSDRAWPQYLSKFWYSYLRCVLGTILHANRFRRYRLTDMNTVCSTVPENPFALLVWSPLICFRMGLFAVTTTPDDRGGAISMVDVEWLISIADCRHFAATMRAILSRLWYMVFDPTIGSVQTGEYEIKFLILIIAIQMIYWFISRNTRVTVLMLLRLSICWVGH